jgi:hypothetical protein
VGHRANDGLTWRLRNDGPAAAVTNVCDVLGVLVLFVVVAALV